MNDFNFRGKVAIVTGAASGIGRATAAALADRECTVAIFDRNATQAREWRDQMPATSRDRISVHETDVTDPDAVEKSVRQVADDFGGVDLLCHCAGVQSYGTMESTEVVDWKSTLAVDLDSAFYVSRSVIPPMKSRGGGSIVLTGSTQSLVAHRNSAAYVTGKHALLGIMRSIAVDFASFGIRCNCVLPGAIDTPMIRWSASRDPHPEKVLEACASLALLGRMGTPDEVASMNLFLLSGLASFITGSSIVVDGGQLTPCGGTAFQLTGTGGE